MNSLKKILLFLFFITSSISFYEGNTPIVILNSSNFDKLVTNSPDIWLIEFFAPWCGHCKNFAPEYEKAAKVSKGIFKIGAINADAEKSLASRFNIQGFPTVKFFGSNKNSPIDYQGARSADAVINFMFTQAREEINKKLKPKTSSSNNNNNNYKRKTHSTPPGSDKDVIVLDDSNFDDTVYKSKDMWIVAFYAPWCGHCQKLLPEYTAAATQLKGQIKLAKVNAEENKGLSQRFQIRGFPTIKIFAPGDNKSDRTAEEYNGPREAAGIVQYALEKLEKYGYVPETKQLISQSILKETCIDRTGICVIVFLPHIADSNKNERNKYLDIIKDGNKSSRGKPVYFLWAQGGDYYDFEDKLHLSFGYPAVIAISFNKKKYSICRKAFSKDNLVEFINGLLLGKEPLMNLPEFKEFKKVDKWDGKDYIPPKTEKSDDL